MVCQCEPQKRKGQAVIPGPDSSSLAGESEGDGALTNLVPVAFKKSLRGSVSVYALPR